MNQTSQSHVTIKDVQTIITAPGGIRMVVVKIITSEPGLFGLGCATFTQRAWAVVTAINEYLKPFVIGRNVDDIEDVYQAAHVSPYWRFGPVLNNALSGIDQALWDIKGKRAGMPVYQLIGGKARQAVPVYVHADGNSPEEVAENVQRYMDQGFRYIRVQMNVRGYSTYGSGGSSGGYVSLPLKATQNRTWEPTPYIEQTPKMFEYLRKAVGEQVELLHDVHERVPAVQAMWLAKALEPYRLFFLEDLFAPEDIEYMRLLRQQCVTPIALGELFANPAEYIPLIQGRLIDFIRCHISTIGGFSQARKLAAFSEFMGVRTAWHGPGDVSWVGHAANMHLDLNSSNFGIQEFSLFMLKDEVKEVFPVTPELKDGALWSNELPGWGVELDEVAAKRYPCPEEDLNGSWSEVRRWDGTVVRP